MANVIKSAICQGTPHSAVKNALGITKIENEICSNNPKTKTELTPLKQILYNPFEIGLHERLQMPSLSPSCFNVKDGRETPKTFRWSIEQMATLNPVEIDDNCLYQNNGQFKFDQEYEQKAQEAINTYFSQRQIVPSPWSNCCCGSVTRQMSYMSNLAKSTEALRRSKQVKIRPTQDVSTQTMLSLPVNFDLQKILGEFYTQDQVLVVPDEDGICANSTLRRKLFSQDDSSLTASLSPDPLSSSPVPVTDDVKRTSVSPLRPFTPPIVSPIISNSKFQFSLMGKCESMVVSFTHNPHSKDDVTNDTGYQTYDTDINKTGKNDLRMSWAPTTCSTPEIQQSQLGMSIDEL